MLIPEEVVTCPEAQGEPGVSYQCTGVFCLGSKLTPEIPNARQ